MDVPIVILSHKRADRVLTTRAIAGCTLCVAESQADEYARHNPGVPIVTHPDTVVGLPPKRQWVLDRWGELFMVDDDVIRMVRMHRMPNQVPPELAYDIIQETAATARELGVYLWGFSTDANPQHYKDFSPFSLSGYILGATMGFLAGSKLRYSTDPDLQFVDDYYICGMNAFHHRMVFKDLRFAFAYKGTFVSSGGQAEYRTVELEKRGTEKLVRLFGSSVIRKKATQYRQRHPYQRTMVVPF